MEAKNILASRQTRYGAFLSIYVIIVIAVLGAVNFLANRYNKSLDLTSNKQYSLSDQTIKVVKGLNQDVTISYFDRADGFQPAKDLLDRYATLSTKLTVEYVDPFKKPQAARQFGVRTTGTTIVRTAAKTQEARSMTEEEITSALIRVVKQGEKTACFVSGAGEPSVDDSAETGYSGAKEVLEKTNYKVQTVDFAEKSEIPNTCTVLVIAGARNEYPAKIVEAFKKYVEGGGHALFMLQPPLDDGKNKIAENKPLIDMLAGWGVTANKDQVLDASGIGGLYGLGPEVALAKDYGSHAIVRDMRNSATAFAITRSLEVKSTDKTSPEKLASTTKGSIATTQLSGVSRKIDPAKAKQDSFTVAAAGTYRGEGGKEGRFVVVGSSDWVANYVFRFAGNRDLFLNMMNWLSNDEDLISIRPKDPADRRIQLTRSQMSLVFFFSQVLLPAFVLIAGIMVWWKRR